MRMMEAIQLLEGIDDPKLSSVHINLGNLYFNYERYVGIFFPFFGYLLWYFVICYA